MQIAARDQHVHPAPPVNPRRAWPGNGDRAASTAAAALGFAFAAVWTWLGIYGHDHFTRGPRDFMIYANTIWSTSSGLPYQSTVLLKNSSHLAEHVAPLLLPLAALWQLVPDERLLIPLQQGALAASGIPVYLLARRRLASAWSAVLVLLTFYLAPALSNVAWYYFHPVALAAVPIAFGAYFVLTGRQRLGALLTLTALLVEETSGLAVFGIGLILLQQRRYRLSALLCAIAAIWLAWLTLVQMPTFHLAETLPEEGNRTLANFRALAAGPAEILELLRERGPHALTWVVLPTAGLFVLSPAAVLAAPTVATLFFGDSGYLFSHRIAPALPLLWLAVVEGLAILRRPWPRRIALALLLAGSLLAYTQESRLPGGAEFHPQEARPAAGLEAMRRAVAAVPADAAVAATAEMAAHLTARRTIKVYPFSTAGALTPAPRDIDWWLVNTAGDDVPERLEEDVESPFRADPPFALWLIGDQVLVVTDRPPAPAGQAPAVFGETFRLRGFEVQTSGTGIRARLDWQLEREAGRSYTRRVTVTGTGGSLLGSHEGPATRRYYSTAQWPVGQRVVEEIDLPLGAATAADLQVEVSWLNPRTDTPLPLEDGATTLRIATGDRLLGSRP